MFHKYKLAILLGMIVLSGFIAYVFTRLHTQDSIMQAQNNKISPTQNTTQENLEASQHSDFTNLLQDIVGNYTLIAMDTQTHEMKQVYRDENGMQQLPIRLEITNEKTLNDDLTHKENNLSIATITQEDNLYRIYTKGEWEEINGVQYAPQTSLAYRFTWIDKNLGLANINGQCYIDSKKLDSSQFTQKIPLANTLQYNLMQNSSSQIAQYANDPAVKQIFGLDWLSFEDKIPLDKIQERTIKVKDSALLSIKNADTTPKEKQFLHTLLLDDFSQISHSNQSSNNQDSAIQAPKRIIMLIALRDDPSITPTKLDSTTQDLQQESTNTIQATSSNLSTHTMQNYSFKPDNIESIMLYKLGDDNSIDLSFGLDITPFKKSLENPCMPYDYIRQNVWIYNNGMIYLQTTTNKSDQQEIQLTKVYALENQSSNANAQESNTNPLAFHLTKSFLNQDCTKQDMCQVSLQDSTYIPQCKDSCILMLQWNLDNQNPLNTSQLSNDEKTIYLNRLKVSHGIAATSGIQLENIDTGITNFNFISLPNKANVNNDLNEDSLIPIPQTNKYAFILAYKRDEKPLVLDLSQNTSIKQLNGYFGVHLFDNSLAIRTLTKVVTCQKCAMFIPHSILESYQASILDLQSYISLQNLFLAKNIAFHQIDETLRELVFEKEGLFGGDKRIDCVSNAGRWILYEKGKTPKIFDPNELTQEKIEKYYSR